ncbi:MAG: hypothetical protein R3F55_21585 [Alphaproteobacteria bacterium]
MSLDPTAFREAKDSVHVLPLRTMPIKTRSLSDALLTKNMHLESVVELFSGPFSGRGHIPPRQLRQHFDFGDGRHDDYELILKLSELASFDVYSVRVALRDLGLDVDTVQHLRLSPEMERQVSSHLAAFIRPLMAQVYGHADDGEKSFADILKLFQSPDVATAKTNLMRLAERLEIGLFDIPLFLARYGDVYLSLSYYAFCLSQLEPTLADFLGVLRTLPEAPGYRGSREIAHACQLIERRLTNARFGIAQVIDIFRVETQHMWSDISSASFQRMEDTIRHYQKDIGGSVCALTVKLNSWLALKGKHHPPRIAAFVMSDMLRGIEHVTQVQFRDLRDQPPAEPAEDCVIEL